MPEPVRMPTTAGFRVLQALGQSLLSTVIVGTIAIAVFCLAHGYSQLEQIKVIASQNGTTLVGVFACLLVWNCRRVFRRRPAPRP